MMHHSRIARTLSIAAALSIAACSDSTGPSASHLAQHFDSLYSAAAGQESIGSFLRAEVMTNLEIPSAFGAIPRDVSVTTASGVEQRKGFEYAINPTSSQLFSNNILVLYRDANAHTALIAGYAQDGSITNALLLANDTVGPEFAIDPNVDAALSHLSFGTTVFSEEVFTSGFGDMGSRIKHNTTTGRPP